MGKKAKKESETPSKETFDAVPVVSKTPATLVLLLSSPEEDILIKACEAIYIFAEKGDENKVCLLGLGALEPLCHLITHNNKLVRRNAFMALGIMASNGDIKTALNKLDVIPVIIDKLFHEDDTVIHEFATLCLASLSVDYTCKVQIFDNKGLPPLIQLLSSPDPDVKKNSLETIINLVQDFSDLHAEALQVVTNCLCDTESLQLLHRGGGLTRLMDFLLTPYRPEIQSTAIKCITRVAQGSENRKLLHEQNVEQILVELLSVADVSVKTSACQAVAAMSFHLPSNDRFRDLGGIPAVVKGLSSESSVLKEAAAQALSNLTHSNQLSAFAVYEAGGHELLVQQLWGSCSSTVAHAAATLANMARHEVIRCSILSQGAIQGLVELLKSTHTQVLVNTVLCLAVLVCDTEARAQLQSAGGLQPLVSLLRSYHKEVLHSACLAVNVCASDKTTVVEMCKLGALEILQEINQSVNLRSSFSELAMGSLLNSNLSVKYSLTGHLASTDIISDGFYDTGKAHAGQRILTLEELSMQPVNQRHPIIAVKTTVEKMKEDEKQKAETQPLTQKPWKMMDDVSLHVLIKEAKRSVLPLNEREQYAALARLVSEAMGGAVEKEKLHEFTWLLHLSQLKFQLQSNVIPIGLIRRGIYCHRALLFKCLADCLGISCTLVRGEYNRAWNEVLLFNGTPSSNGFSSQPCRYIVDLMHQPGSLLAVSTVAAEQYQTI
uniref:armadillo repeat-containing protein 3 isoform X2 n=1 Tax=Monopterus albus TaxID=43700 RepID=UPI0009B3A475|nr:armadillo repeat-containing protein 3 isoform X2 [Monopterus albus]